MMNNIEDLTKKDYYLLERVKELIIKKIDFSSTDIQTEYDNLFVTYTMSENLECLKRAVFLQWYSVSEPFEYTGIGNLDMALQKENLLKIERRIVKNTMDLEFIQMLLHYYSVSDWYFDSILDLKSFFSLNSKSDINISETDNRGLMGEYWKSILNR